MPIGKACSRANGKHLTPYLGGCKILMNVKVGSRVVLCRFIGIDIGWKAMKTRIRVVGCGVAGQLGLRLLSLSCAML